MILGAGFGGLELASGLSDSLADEVRVTLIDQNESFTFGFSKLDILSGKLDAEAALLYYRDIAKPGVEFRQERVTAIDPAARHVTTDRGAYDADILVVALGAEYDLAATPGFLEGGFEYYSIAGAERMRDALPGFTGGTILLGILGQPFKCPPAPFEGAFLLHDQLAERGIRDGDGDPRRRTDGGARSRHPRGLAAASSTGSPERGIEYVPNHRVVEPRSRRATTRRSRAAISIPYDLFVGIPVHRVPEVVESCGLAVDGWVPVETPTWRPASRRLCRGRRRPVSPMAKAGVFAEAAARVVADDIAARLRGDVLQQRYEGEGSCYIEFGGGMVGKVEANFLGGPTPTARLVGPSRELAADKVAFASTRRERWFGTDG